MKRLFFISLLFLVGVGGFGQNPEIKRTWHWYFGYGVGIDFSGGNPVAVTNGALYSFEGCSAISDINGNLLFYTNGDTVWNKNHAPMVNGFDVGGKCGAQGSSSQGSIIIPQPWSESLYYIFMTDCWEDSLLDGFRYAIVDMSLQGGLGDVVSKDNLLLAPVVEKVTAAHHQNNDDIWVITHELGNNSYYAYLITNSGLNPAPVVSSIGSVQSEANWGVSGYLKASPDGSRIACALQGMALVELFDFDRATGALSNLVSLNAVPAPYGVEFSPDGNILYVAFINSTEIFQFDLLAGNQSDINNSAIVVGIDSNFVQFPVGALQLAPDGKIYLARYPYDTLGVIKNPDILGMGCTYVQGGPSLSGKINGYGLPNFISTYFGSEATGAEAEEIAYNAWLPNIFSPNGDSNNDVLYVRGNNIEELTFMIYNRWGEKVFESTTKDDGWRGEGYNSGVYVYRASGTYTDDTPFEIKGNITLVR